MIQDHCCPNQYQRPVQLKLKSTEREAGLECTWNQLERIKRFHQRRHTECRDISQHVSANQWFSAERTIVAHTNVDRWHVEGLFWQFRREEHERLLEVGRPLEVAYDIRLEYHVSNVDFDGGRVDGGQLILGHVADTPAEHLDSSSLKLRTNSLGNLVQIGAWFLIWR